MIFDEVEFWRVPDIRYYMGRHKIGMVSIKNKKAIILHLERGYVGNKNEGYKEVEYGDFDICLVRACRYKKRN